ncbi:hypothetical protein TMatcc_004195 [Talaromyces marneffei ATCC 18224]|uniref:Gfd2/YDR514C-like C-terminal domain-containing protein n=1 Tax=Talaromyces marneffei (strain ATCC 18224 / CBS 334.59 / QM 7333) TaxID=441960 RepID=B6Q614_TALMQ|nr:conserved hypothetical protein [Talaromyces marneffei ATCC 18224]
MEKATQRLNLLFLNNESLLEEDTGLRLPISKTKSEDPSTPSQNVAHKKQHLYHGNSIQSSTSVAAKNLTVVPNKVGKPQTRLDHGMDKEDGNEFDERSAFESGIEASMTLVARSFCPAAGIIKLPYKYMHGLTAERIGKRFFDRGQFWAREWDLYYIFPPRDLALGPLLLLPASQVQQFLDLISKDYNIRLTIPMDPELGLLLSFQEEGMPKPQYLGRSSVRDVKDDLVSAMSLLPRDSVNSIDQAADGSVVSADIVDAFRRKMEAGLNATKKKSKALREKRRALKIERQREWVRSLKRAQCYLGLLPRCSDRAKDCCDVTDQTISKDELTASLPPLLPEKLAPYSFADQPIFISVDVEWNERQRNQITEVGISTLDTLDIAHVAPGPGGKNWQPWIRSRHIRIKEYAHVVNCDFVSGCPDEFGFGKSEFVPLRDAARLVESCFKPPYSAQVPVKFVNDEANRDKRTVTIETAIEEYKLRPRNVVLVGHGLHADIKYLGALGCNLFSGNAQSQKTSQVSVTEPSTPTAQSLFLDTLDTATMFQALKRDVHVRGLENVLASLGILSWHLHNAGNDARYTLEAMIRMIINARAVLDKAPHELSGNYIDWAVRPVSNSDTTVHKLAWQTEVDRRVSEAAADQEEQIRDDCKIWEIVIGWDSGHPLTSHDMDGGKPNGFIFT